MSYIDESWWQARGFSVREDRDGHHTIILSSPDLFLTMWPRSEDERGRPKWMAYCRTFHASASEVARALEARRFKMPENAGEAKCRDCDAPIWWVKSQTGKNVPLDKNGDVHFAHCPKRNGG